MARDFNGSSDYIIGNLTWSTAFPASLYVKFNNDTDDGIALSLTASTGSNYLYIGWTTAGRGAYAATRSTSTYTIAQTGVNPATGSWHHLLGVFTDSSNRKVYCDSDSGTTGLAGTSTPSGMNRVAIGAALSGGSPTGYVNARIAEAAVWNVALTAADYASLQADFPPSEIRPQSLVFYAPLIRDVQDLRGGLSLTTTGTSVAVHPRRMG